jgi:hypothetical protein
MKQKLVVGDRVEIFGYIIPRDLLSGASGTFNLSQFEKTSTGRGTVIERRQGRPLTSYLVAVDGDGQREIMFYDLQLLNLLDLLAEQV